MTPEEIRQGIAAYDIEQETLLRVIQEHDGRLTQDEFDEEFKDFRHGRAQKPRRFRIVTDQNAFILGGIMFGSWPKWIHLLQLMVELGDVKQSGKPPNIVYEIPA